MKKVCAYILGIILLLFGCSENEEHKFETVITNTAPTDQQWNEPSESLEDLWKYPIGDTFFFWQEKYLYKESQGPDFSVNFYKNNSLEIGWYRGLHPSVPSSISIPIESKRMNEAQWAESYRELARKNDGLYSWKDVANSYDEEGLLVSIDSVLLQVVINDSSNFWVQSPLPNHPGKVDILVEFHNDIYNYYHIFSEIENDAQRREVLRWAIARST